jgi:hypothetical protein
MAHALSNMLHRIVRILQNVSEQGMTGRALFRTKALRGSDVEGMVEEFPLCSPDAHLRLPSRVHKKNRTDQRLPTRIIWKMSDWSMQNKNRVTVLQESWTIAVNCRQDGMQDLMKPRLSAYPMSSASIGNRGLAEG